VNPQAVAANPLVIARRKAAARDEWDCLVGCIKTLGDAALDSMRGELEEITGFGDRWSLEWVSGQAGFACKHEPVWLPYREMLAWARRTLGLSDAALESYRTGFFRKRDNLPRFDFAFVGRTHELEALEELLEQGARVCLSMAALHGIGGIGKTAIAYHYAQSRQQRYAAVIWIDGRADIEEQLYAFARADAGLQLEGEGAPQDRLADTFEKLALSLRGRILIVVDDVAANPASEKHPSRSEAQVGRVTSALPGRLFSRYDLLLTSRHTIRTVAVETMAIERMTRDDAVDLFLQRSGFARSALDPGKLATLVDTQLGGHPLAIALLASYAGKRRIKNIDRLADMVRQRIVDAQELRGTVLGEYKPEIYGTFKISFDELSRDAQLLFLVLAMFRRSVISIETVKSCAQYMTPATAEVDALRGALIGRGGPTPSARLLTRLALAERIDGPLSSQRSQVKRVQLHEVIYDFAQVQWTLLRAQPQWQRVLDDLELSFARGAIRYASAQISESTIKFRDVDSLSGLLLPQVRDAQGLLPSPERVAESLTFWYEHFVFQNFIYDTGLQDGLLEQMIALHRHLEKTQRLTPHFGLILDKLIGHAYYANPRQTGALARQHFDRALVLAEQLDAQHVPEEGKISIARWYKIFLLDHRSNVASKNRPEMAQTLAIREDPLFAPDFAAVEAALPDVLKTLDATPSEEECELLLRAAHYWGHRGNQDSHIQFQKFIDGRLQVDRDPICTASRDHYMKAANYRLLALKIFRTGQFDRYLASAGRRGALPFLVRWIGAAPSLKPQQRFESFTSLAQGIGDAAHQYRGLHFVFAIDFLATTDVQSRAKSRQHAEDCLRCARLLWEIAQQTLTDDEAPLRYRLWMSSSELVMNLLDDLQAGRPIAAFDQVLEHFRASIARMQETMRSTYPYCVGQQESQLRAIWNRVAS
jgi:hypothetical protein